MHTICKQYGKVRKIVVFRKSVLQSMVEFEDIPSASGAMRELNGADIYSGCCTLKAEYAKVKQDISYFIAHITCLHLVELCLSVRLVFTGAG